MPHLQEGNHSESFLEEVASEEALKPWEGHEKSSTCHCRQSALGTRAAYVTSAVRASRG